MRTIHCCPILQWEITAQETGALTSNAKCSAERAQDKFLQFWARVATGDCRALTLRFEGGYSTHIHAPVWNPKETDTGEWLSRIRRGIAGALE